MRDGDDVFWARVHAVLDAREDPLADPEIVEAMLASPARAQALVSLAGALDAVRMVPVTDFWPPRRTGSIARRCAAAAAIVAVIGLAYYAKVREPAPLPRLEARAVLKTFPPGQTPVSSWSVSITRREGATVIVDSVGPAGLSLSDAAASRGDFDCVARVTFLRSTRFP